jgi:hypothetical protein
MHFGRARRRPITRSEREEITRRIMGQIAALLQSEREPSAAATEQAGRS